MRKKQRQEQQAAITKTVCEFIDIKFELSNYIDEGLIDLGSRFDKAIEELIKAADVAELVNQ